jgi:hypothetical protein
MSLLNRVIIISAAVILATAAASFIYLQDNEIYVNPNFGSTTETQPEFDVEVDMEVNTGAEESIKPEDREPVFPVFENRQPEIIKAIYVTSWSASRPSYIDYVVNLARNTEINGVVIDIKDWSGYIAYDTKVPEAEKYGAKSIRIRNVNALVERLRGEGIYSIARITVFQDPVLARARPDLAVHSKASPASLWFDRSGLAWIDPAAKESWDYNIAIAREAIELGFDEINFDYIRFPSDGNLRDMSFPLWDGSVPRSFVMREFFSHMRGELPDAKLSVDLFGLSTVNFDDLGIGQIIEDAFEYFDYVSPMVYPSHYAPGFLGYQNPASYPYEVVKYSIENALKRLSAFDPSGEKSVWLRPWLQDFNLGAIYDAGMVRSQIAATYDATGDSFSGFMLWNSSNVYTEEALER